MSIETLGTLGAFEGKKSIKEELGEIKELHKKREALQKRWSKIFEEITDLDLKYPTSVQYDENKKFRNDRGFYSPEDLVRYQTLNPEFEQIDAEMKELDKEILRLRFEVGLKYLEIISSKDAQWKLVEKHIPDTANPKSEMDFLHIEKWRCVLDDIEASFEFSADAGQTSFFEGMKKVAEQIGDTEVVKKIAEWPEERKVPYNNIHASFSVGPKTFLPSNKDLLPGLSIHKTFGFKEEYDRVDAGFPLSFQGHTFPSLDDAQKEQAKVEMLKLSQKIGIEGL